MDKLIEIRNQEMICRARAQLDSERRDSWLAKAEEWKRRALDEIAFHFIECNGAGVTGDVAKATSNESIHYSPIEVASLIFAKRAPPIHAE